MTTQAAMSEKLSKSIAFPANGKDATIAGWQKLRSSVPIPEGRNTKGSSLSNRLLTVVDFDLLKPGDAQNLMDGVQVGEMIIDQCPDVIDTFQVKSGSGGLHYYFKHNPRLKSRSQVVTVVRNNDIFRAKINVKNVNMIYQKGICPSNVMTESCEIINDVEPQTMPEWVEICLTTPLIIDDDEIEILEEACPESYRNQYDYDEVESDIIKCILAGLSPQRADNRDDWLMVCFACGKISRAQNIDVLPWLKFFGSRSDKYNEIETTKNYERSKGDSTIKTLWWMLMLDNPSKWSELRQKHEDNSSKIYYYNDFRTLAREAKEKGELSLMAVKNYIKSAFVRVIGSESTWLIREDSKWTRVKKIDFSDVNFKFRYNNRDYTLKNVFESMRKSQKLTLYGDIDYSPYLIQHDDSHAFNTFVPFPFRYKAIFTDADNRRCLAAVDLILKHIKLYLCNDNEAIYSYYLRYIAHAFQYPSIKPERSLIIISRRDVGEYLINRDLMSKIFGEWNYIQINSRRLHSKYNVYMADKLWCVVSMVDTDFSKQISTNYLTIHSKRSKPYTISDRRRIICFSDRDQKRSSNVYIWNAGSASPPEMHFDELIRCVNDPVVQEAFFDYITHLNLSGFQINSPPEIHA
jgi:hypothetical protein